MPYNTNIREEELKNRVAHDYFNQFDTANIIGNIDFCISTGQKGKELFEQDNLLWAEAKKGISDIHKSLVQLILTIGKARTFDKYLPPTMLGAFDSEKIAFLPYNDVHDIFYLNDFNWNVTPSNYDTKEFKLVSDKVSKILDNNTLIFYFEKDDIELKRFIKDNFIVGKYGLTKTQIDKNNFIVIYNKWLQAVKPTIAVNWDIAKKKDLISGDFYLADLLSQDNVTLKDKLFVVLKATKYELNRHIDEYGAFTSSTIEFNDGQKAHNQFWNKYERPPKEEYWDYIIERRDLLVPQDVRERKGSFFTPQIWVGLSQEYLKDVLGENWQDEYYIWDCAAGTGNLLNGLTNKYNIWASTLDKQDVEVMKDRIKNGANLLESHVFQFDFLNDEFTKLPQPLQDIINNPEKRKKLVIYINPPYAEAGTGLGKGHKKDITLIFNINEILKPKIGNAVNEIFALFMAIIYQKIPDCKIGQFSKLKFVNGSNFKKFKSFFLAEYKGGFITPAETFDNVNGKFPIGFTIWDTAKKSNIETVSTDIYDRDSNFLGVKNFFGNLPKGINQWINIYQEKNNLQIGFLDCSTPDFQNKNYVFIDNLENDKDDHRFHLYLTNNNLLNGSVYFSVRHCIEATWLNDRDQFLYPNNGWQDDKEFQSDCLVFTLFHGQNKITSKDGTNHWIPFTEQEVNASEKFESNFMTDFINGKIKIEDNEDKLFEAKPKQTEKLVFSDQAQAVFDAGRELWKYYHATINDSRNEWKGDKNVNASLYDIRAYFQGRNEAGRMNSSSDDAKYMELINKLREEIKKLATKIEPKVYEYGFLKK